MIQAQQPGCRRSEQGQVSAEFAVGILVVVALVGGLSELARDLWASRLIGHLIEAMTDWFRHFIEALPLPR